MRTRHRLGRSFVCLLLFSAITVVCAEAQEPPRVLWEGSVYDPGAALAAISDVSDDGLPDVIAGSEGSMVLCFESATGEEWWSYDVGDSVWALCGVGDTDGLGQEDVLVGTSGNNVFCLSGESDGYGGGVEVWRKPMAGDVWTVCSIGDIPSSGDGRREAVAGIGNGTVVCLSGANGMTLWTAPLGYVVWSVARCPSVNGDSVDEVIAGIGANAVCMIDGRNGNVLWSYSISGDAWIVAPAGDVNGDGATDVLAGTGDDRVLCLSGNATTSGSLIWQCVTGSDIRALAVAPNSATGNARVAAGGLDDRLYVLSRLTGGVCLRIDKGFEILSLAPLQDLTYNNWEEFVSGTTAHCVDCQEGYVGKTLWTSSFSGEGATRRIVSLGDISGDGIDEIVGLSSTGRIMCLQPAEAPAASVDWALFE